MTDATYTGQLDVTFNAPIGPRGVPQITIPLRGSPKGKPAPVTPTTPPAGNDPWADLSTDYVPANSPGSKVNAAQGAQVGDPWADLSADYEPAPTGPPQRQVGTGEALARGAADTASFGTAPIISGLNEAGNVTAQADPALAATTQPSGGARSGAIPALSPVLGAAKMFDDWITQSDDPKVRDAYERGRKKAVEDQQLAQEQHPLVYLTGQLAGAVAGPGMGAVSAPAKFTTRVMRGAIGGGEGTAAYTAGTDASQEKSLPETVKDVAVNTPIGMGLGGAAGGLLGPGVVKAATTPGQRAAATARDIGAPIPRGIASDNRAIQSTTGAAQSFPLIGSSIRKQVDATQEAAGHVIGQSGIDEAITANKARINSNYDAVRGQIDPDKVMPMPRTAAAVFKVKAKRAGARQSNPGQGLDQFDNIAQQGASFNGAHRARVDARDAGDALSPHPGYNAADYNAITQAMTADIRANVAAQGGGRAVSAFEKAEKSFGPISGANKFLKHLATKSGPGAGLDEIGFNPSTGQFSLNKFVTAWNKINPEIKPFIPEAAHARNIEAIFEMGQHIKSSLREGNTSHTAAPLIMLDMARDAIMTSVAVGTGVASGASVLGTAALGAPVILFMRWLANPAKAASMGAWSRAYRATITNPTPARIGVLTAATRNMANNLGLDPAVVLKSLQSHIQTLLPGRAEDQGADQNN